MTLKSLIENTDTRAGRAFDLSIQGLILVSLVSFSIETLPNLNATVRFWLYVIEVVIVAIFTIEYGLRLLVADNRLRFMFSFYGLVDLIAILPFYISTGIDLRAVRIFRLLRMFRVFKFLRYTEAIQRFKEAFIDIKAELTIYAIATALTVYVSAVGIYYFENAKQPEAFASIFHALWWAVVTLTTVGYGDVYPVTVGGKIFTTIILVLGLGIVAVPTGLLAASLAKADRD